MDGQFPQGHQEPPGSGVTGPPVLIPTARRGVQLAYAAALVAGFVIYKVFGAEMQALLLAGGAPDGWAGALPHVVGLTCLSAACAGSVFLSVPAGPLFYVAFGSFYGPVEGTLVAALASTAGSVAAFCFFRTAMPPAAAAPPAGIGNIFVTLALLRSSPWIPNPLITLFCSAFGVGLWTFTLATFFGTLPLIAIYTLAASRLSGPFDASALYSPEFAAAFTLLSVVSVLGLLKPIRIVRDTLKALQAEAAEAAASP